MQRLLSVGLLCLAAQAVAFTQIRSMLVNEPPELAAEPEKRGPASEALQQFEGILKEWNFEDDLEKLRAIRPKLDKLIEQHPSFADGYATRAVADGCYLRTKDYPRITADFDNAIRFTPTDGEHTFDLSKLYGYRARVKFEAGDLLGAIDDLERAMHDAIDTADAIYFGSCNWDLPDLDALVQKFPKDFRSTLLRGVFLTSSEENFPQALREFQNAADLNPKSALPHYFVGHLYFRSLTSDSDALSEASRRAAMAYTSAIELDPHFVQAYAERAAIYAQLKETRQAVKDYDKVLQLDPNYQDAYLDRASAKMGLGEYLDAITDLGDFIRLAKPHNISLRLAYERRAEAYMKIGNYNNAVADLDKAIGGEFGNDSFLMKLSDIRAIYPEYKNVPGDPLVNKIRSLFWPNFTYNELLDHLAKNEEPHTFRLADLYEKRGDAYLALRDFRRAVAEYNRAFVGFGDYGRNLDRWRHFTSAQGADIFVDVKTIEFPPSGGIGHLWFKARTKKSTYSLDSYEVDCKARRVNHASTVVYGDNAEIRSSSELHGGWQSIVPDTIGEQMYICLCASSR